MQVLEIVSSQAAGKHECLKYTERQHHNEKMQNALGDLPGRVYQLRLYSQYQISAQHSTFSSLCKVKYFE